MMLKLGFRRARGKRPSMELYDETRGSTAWMIYLVYDMLTGFKYVGQCSGDPRKKYLEHCFFATSNLLYLRLLLSGYQNTKLYRVCTTRTKATLGAAEYYMMHRLRSLAEHGDGLNLDGLGDAGALHDDVMMAWEELDLTDAHALMREYEASPTTFGDHIYRIDVLCAEKGWTGQPVPKRAPLTTPPRAMSSEESAALCDQHIPKLCHNTAAHKEFAAAGRLTMASIRGAYLATLKRRPAPDARRYKLVLGDGERAPAVIWSMPKNPPWGRGWITTMSIDQQAADAAAIYKREAMSRVQLQYMQWRTGAIAPTRDAMIDAVRRELGVVGTQYRDLERELRKLQRQLTPRDAAMKAMWSRMERHVARWKNGHTPVVAMMRDIEYELKTVSLQH